MKRKEVPHQEHFGRKFYQDKKTGYWISCTYPRVRAHRWVWQQHHGFIPKKWHVHHKDEDRSNNVIENLTIVSPSDHLKLHFTDEKRAALRKIADENRHLTKGWHKSEEGKAWHIYHAKKHRFGKWESRECTCENCEKTYQTTKLSNSRFCSNNCKSAFRRKSGVDDREFICPMCNAVFICNKYSKKKCCSITCAKKFRWQNS